MPFIGPISSIACFRDAPDPLLGYNTNGDNHDNEHRCWESRLSRVQNEQSGMSRQVAAERMNFELYYYYFNYYVIMSRQVAAERMRK